MNLKEFRTNNRLTVADVASSLGITRQHVYEIERGSAYPSRKLALRIEEATKGAVTLRDLFPKDAK